MPNMEAPPFERGSTYYNGGTIDSANLGGGNLEGRIYEFADLDFSNVNPGARPARSGRTVFCMVVRNVAAAALLPKRLVTLQKTAGNAYLGKVDGYATITADRCYPVDEFLPAAGVAVNDLFYIVVKGPAMVLTDLAGADNNVLPVSTILVSLTGATSGATTSGRVAPQDLTGATAVLGAQLNNVVGRALSAKTTGNTNADIWAEIGRW